MEIVFQHTSSIKVIHNPYPTLFMRQKHIILLPALCPKTNNPAQGSQLSIEYRAHDYLLELFSLENYIHSFIGHTQVRDVEHFIQVVALDCTQILQQPVKVKAIIYFNGLAQQQKITVKAKPSDILSHTT